METVSTMQAEFADLIGRPGRIGWARARYRRRPRSAAPAARHRSAQDILAALRAGYQRQPARDAFTGASLPARYGYRARS